MSKKKDNKKEIISSEELEEISGGWIPEPKAEEANKLAMGIADLYE